MFIVISFYHLTRYSVFNSLKIPRSQCHNRINFFDTECTFDLISVQIGRLPDDGMLLLNRKAAPPPVLTNGINTKMDIEAILAREASKRGLKLADLKADIEEKSLSLSDLELISNIPAKTLSIEGSQRKVLCNGDLENGGVKLSVGRSHGKANGDSKKSNSKGRNDIDEDENSDSGDSTASSGVLRSSTSSSPKSVSCHCRFYKMKFACYTYTLF